MLEAYCTNTLAMILGVTPQAIRKRAGKESWPCRTRQGRGGGKEYLLSGLPQDVREALARQAAESSPAGRLAGLGLGALAEQDNAAGIAARADGLSRYQRLSTEGKARADARAELVRMCQVYARTAEISSTKARKAFAIAYNAGRIEVASSVRAVLDTVSAGSLRNWELALEKEGLAGLAGEYGTHRKGTGTIDSIPELREFVVGMLTEFPHCSAQHVAQGIATRFAKEKRPSLRALQRWIRAWKEDNEQVFCALKNPDNWRSQYKSAAGSASEHIVRLNQVWEYDSTPGDVMLNDGKRHVVIGVIDVYSRRVQLHVERSSCSAGICAVTRKALLAWGVPEIAKTDNGSDYVSKQMVRVYQGLGIYHERAPHFTPEKKPFIERVFRTFSHGLLELLPGFVGHNVTERKDIEARKSFAQRLCHKGETVDLSYLSVEEFQKFCDTWADSVYQHNPHEGLGGKTPWERTSEWTGPINRLADERALDVLLLPAPGDDGWRDVAKKAVKACGGHYNHALLGGLEGSRVRVMLDESDAGYVYVFDEAGEYVCRAEDPDLTGTSRAEIAARRREHQKKLIAEQKAELKAAAKRANVKDIAKEILNHRAEEAGKLSRLPQQSTPYTTDALDQAGIAARSTDAPPAQSEANAAARAQLDHTAVVHHLPETPRQRWNRWAAIDAALLRGDAVSEGDKDFYKLWRQTAEWASWRDLMEWTSGDVDAVAQ